MRDTGSTSIGHRLGWRSPLQLGWLLRRSLHWLRNWTIDQRPKRRSAMAKVRYSAGVATRAKTIALLVLCLSAAMVLVNCTHPTASSSVQTDLPKSDTAPHWKNVAIGGGGYVTGIYLHPHEPDLAYIRTDIGGFYRWQPSQERWLPLTEHFKFSERNYFGGEALALDPTNPDLVYIAAGKYVSVGPGALFKSTDRGETWQQSDLQVPMGGNDDKRWAGNRLAVNPFDASILLFGSRQDGLWRSVDGGMTWKAVTALPAKPQDGIGVLAIAFDPQIPGQVYLSAYGDGIYRSGDAGSTWQALEGSSVRAMQLAIAKDSTLYVTSDIAPGVSRYTNGIWQDITPDAAVGVVFNGLSVHPQNPNVLLVSVGETGATPIFYSSNGGATWAEKSSRVEKAVHWLPSQYFPDHTAAIQFDPQHANRVWLTDWFGIWRTEDITARIPTWTDFVKGHEQVVLFSLVSPPEGLLLISGVADVEGFHHSQLDAFPIDRLGLEIGLQNWERYLQDTYSIAYSATAPEQLARVGGYREKGIGKGATSSDGGLTWEPFPTFPEHTLPMRVAISATKPDTFVVTVSEGKAISTEDGGQSWQQVEGLPNGPKGPWEWSQPLVADGVNGQRFYYYSAGTVYRSNDGGRSFAPIFTVLPKEEWHSIQTMPGIENELWVSLNHQGLYRSTDGGSSFSKISSVKQAYLVSLGKSPKGIDNPVIYLYGTLSTRNEGIFVSCDRGLSWTAISNPRAPIGIEPRTLEASKQVPGLIFIGTDGRGIYYRKIPLDQLHQFKPIQL